MPIFKSKATNHPSFAAKYDEDRYRGLENIINLAINAKITLTTNIWISKGLVNGANGVIKDVIFDSKNLAPIALLINFENYTGPKLFNDNDERKNWIPINIFEAFDEETKTTRKQFPVRLAYALTIHKSQVIII